MRLSKRPRWCEGCRENTKSYYCVTPKWDLKRINKGSACRTAGINKDMQEPISPNSSSFSSFSSYCYLVLLIMSYTYKVRYSSYMCVYGRNKISWYLFKDHYKIWFFYLYVIESIKLGLALLLNCPNDKRRNLRNLRCYTPPLIYAHAICYQWYLGFMACIYSLVLIENYLVY